jgi:hypothetical protein
MDTLANKTMTQKQADRINAKADKVLAELRAAAAKRPSISMVAHKATQSKGGGRSGVWTAGSGFGLIYFTERGR